MYALISNGVIAQFVPLNTAFEWEGISYPSNWISLSTPEEQTAIGLVPVVYGAYPNDIYYWVSQDAPVYTGTVVKINYTATPKDLFECQMQAVNNVNQTAWGILTPSDWMVVKGYETKSAISPAWNTWREDIRAQCRAQVIAINGCTTVDQLAALPPVQWEPDPNQPKTPTTPTVTP